jgi:hypothetical protein
MERVKIRTRKGRILTIVINSKTSTHIYGCDKFGVTTIIPLSDIDSMIPCGGCDEK